MTATIQETLKKCFGFNEFRPNQKEIIENILSGRDVFVIMPTGGGKSLCFQLPAKIMTGVTVVISPLISLMKDQVEAALENNIQARFINSSLDFSAITGIYQQIMAGKVDLLYISPERLANENFYKRLKQMQIALFAIDEAHCISQWGHDFRPDYLRLSCLKDDFPNVPRAAFTATATHKVQEDISKRLALRDPLVVRASFNRPNLSYQVARKEEVQAQIYDFITQRPGQPGIIYRTTRKSVADLSNYLNQRGISCLPYHAGLSPEEREQNQDAFNKDEVQVMAATIAFGMGIDKSNVRFVVHGDLPKNIEGYYQETGRAGRDGEKAHCLLFYSPKDLGKINFFIDQITKKKERDMAYKKLSQMVELATSHSCRRRQLLAYFGEHYEKDNCESCDICQGDFKTQDITRDAQIVMSAIVRTRENFGANHIIDLVFGANTKRIRELNHQEIKTYGKGSDKSKSHWRYIIDELLSANALEQTLDQYPVLKLTQKGNDILFNGVLVSAMVPVFSRLEKKSNMPGTAASSGLLEHLKQFRKDLAKEQKVPPYVIFSDKSLKEMAEKQPVDNQSFLRISGVGEMKLQKYGDLFIEQIRIFTNTSGTPESSPMWQMSASAAALNSKSIAKRPPGASTRDSIDMIKQGLSIEDIAKQRELSPSTILGHLENWLAEGNRDLSIDRFVSPEKFDLIKASFEKLDTWKLSPVVEDLNNSVSYEEAKIVRGFLQGQKLGALAE
ncbi:MAG: DNA helicase RecQ [Spirochaetales bacterium]|nr:DNA helicase RecQ [Spirochaetales bacterium]